MRDIRTVISRVQCDLPITDEEREGLEKHLEEFAKFQKKIHGFVALMLLLGIIAVIALIKSGIL